MKNWKPPIHPQGMTKGKALLLARELLGQFGHVTLNRGAASPCAVGTLSTGGDRVIYGVGRTWPEALKAARLAA